jgi:hypothetical protein
MPTFRNTLFHLHRQVGNLLTYEDGSVPKRRHTKFRRRGIIQKKTLNVLRISVKCPVKGNRIHLSQILYTQQDVADQV